MSAAYSVCTKEPERRSRLHIKAAEPREMRPAEVYHVRWERNEKGQIVVTTTLNEKATREDLLAWADDMPEAARKIVIRQHLFGMGEA